MKNEQSLSKMMGIDAGERASRLEFVGFTENDAKILLELRSMIAEYADYIVDKFYLNISRYNELMTLINNAGSAIDRLKKTQKQYLLEMFGGEYGEAYFNRRLKIGVIHNKIGLTPRWYLGSYVVYLEQIIPLIIRKFRWNSFKRAHALSAFVKILSIDSQLAMDTYIHDLHSVKSNIESRVTEYRAFIGEVAAGDLRNRIKVEGMDDLATLGENLNGMTESLSGMALEIKGSSSIMNTTLEELQAAINAQSSGASEQAAAVIETTTTLQQIKSTSSQTLGKAQTLGEVAERTRREGEQGLEVVEQAIKGMKDVQDHVMGIAQTILALSEHSQQIGEITSVVTTLAQQSKMLALNASIEAAKAGEAGKGFAVVAAEVRDLAEQSQQSTAQVQKILQDIRHATDRAVMATEQGSKGVDAGVVLVERAGDVMKKLSGVIQEAVLASQQIVSAVRQEATGIDQASLAMVEINKVIAQFVSGAQQSKQAVSDLSSLARKLLESVAKYKT